MRIFPGKKTYDDTYADERRLVFAVVKFTEDPPAGTKKMWFRASNKMGGTGGLSTSAPRLG
jgi:hypothetical protein